MSGFGGTSSGGGGGSGTVGPGTINSVAKFTAATVVGDSNIVDNGSNVIVNAGAAGSAILISRAAVGQTGDLFQVQDNLANTLSCFKAAGELCVFTTSLVGAEKLRVSGDAHFDGQVRSISSFYLINFLSAEDMYFESDDASSAAVSGAATGRIRYNDTTGTWQVSTQGSIYVDLGTTGGVGPGTVNTVAKFTGVTTVGDSSITDTGALITLSVGTVVSPFAGTGFAVQGGGYDVLTASAATASVYVNNDGGLTGTLGVFSHGAATVVTQFKGAAAQTADLTQWLNSASTVLSVVDDLGKLVIGGTAVAATEMLRVVGDARIEGKLTVTGVIDPTALILSGSTDMYIESSNGDTAALSGAATGRLRYNNTTGTWQQSVQGGAYTNISGGGGTPAGANTQVQFNNLGAFGASTTFTFNGSTVSAPALDANGSGAYVQISANIGAGVSAATSAKLIYDSATDKLRVSLNGAAYVDVATGQTTAAISTKTANYTITNADYTILGDAPAATPITITLPTAVGRTGTIFVVKKMNSPGADTVTVDAAGAETIDGLASIVLIPQYDSVMVQSDGANWVVI